MKLVLPGLALTAMVTAVLVWAFGQAALLPGVVFGLVATAIQVAAGVFLQRAKGKPFEQLLKAWGMGMGLRVLGIFLFLAAVLIDRTIFPPLATAVAYVGVLIPLMFSDLRTLR